MPSFLIVKHIRCRKPFSVESGNGIGEECVLLSPKDKRGYVDLAVLQLVQSFALVHSTIIVDGPRQGACEKENRKIELNIIDLWNANVCLVYFLLRILALIGATKPELCFFNAVSIMYLLKPFLEYAYCSDE